MINAKKLTTLAGIEQAKYWPIKWLRFKPAVKRLKTATLCMKMRLGS
jgi:hypothetical protein